MNVLITGATGMIGQAVLREALHDESITSVTTLGRAKTGISHPKLSEIEQRDLFNLNFIDSQLRGFDACIFCLGVTSAGKSELQYRSITYDLTLSVARTLLKLNPSLTFLYVSGQGTDSSERGPIMWSRIKGKTENDLLKLGFINAYMFRPGAVIPRHGVKSKTLLYQLFYVLLTPISQFMLRIAPRYAVASDQLAKAMLQVSQEGYSKPILENSDIHQVVKDSP